jgi:hypothetical protein
MEHSLFWQAKSRSAGQDILHLTQWNTASFGKLKVAQLVKIFPNFYATPKFITVFKGGC